MGDFYALDNLEKLIDHVMVPVVINEIIGLPGSVEK